MTDRPILFSGAMVSALLAGTKTQTRRVVKPQPYIDGQGNFCWNGMNFGQDFNGPHIQSIASPIPSSKTKRVHCPYGKPGDRLWVREAWQYYDWNDIGEPCIRYAADDSTAWPEPSADDWSDKLLDIWAGLSAPENYKIDNHARDRRWRPSIHMPRWASRITLEITGVRVERLQDISEADAVAEGCHVAPKLGTRQDYQQELEDARYATRRAYRDLWEQINGPGSWDANPWVWVLEFKVVTP